MNSQQLGKFYISEELVRDNPEIVASAFKDLQLVPVRVEVLFAFKNIMYIGISPKFKEIEKGMIVPEYSVDIFVNQAEEDGPKEYSHVEVTKI